MDKEAVGLGIFFSDNELRRGDINPAPGRQQVPVFFKGNLLGLGHAYLWGWCVDRRYRLRARIRIRRLAVSGVEKAGHECERRNGEQSCEWLPARLNGVSHGRLWPLWLAPVAAALGGSSERPLHHANQQRQVQRFFEDGHDAALRGQPLLVWAFGDND